MAENSFTQRVGYVLMMVDKMGKAFNNIASLLGRNLVAFRRFLSPFNPCKYISERDSVLC